MRAAVLGKPIAHSLSPVLHTAAYSELGLTDWSYQAIECDEAGLAGLLGSLGPDWAGVSLTMPLKRAVLPLLDSFDPVVAETGVANTVVMAGGRRVGHNTDVAGLLAALRESGVNLEGPVLVLGAGATACSAVSALARAKVTAVTVAVRDPRGAGQLGQLAARLGVQVQFVSFEASHQAQDWRTGPAGQPWRLLLSTVPAGAADRYAELVGAGELIAAAVFDVVYDPWPTALAVAASRGGVPLIGGFELLLHQAAEQVTLMTGRQPPVAVMRSAGLAELASRAARR